MRVKGPLSNSYPGAVALVVFALTPYLVLSTALLPLGDAIVRDVGLSQQAFELTTGMANAAYAFGTVLAVQLAVHLRGRRLLIVYATLFLIASILAATAWTPGLFIAGRIVQGLTTSLMLISAVPPLVLGWQASKVPWTAGIMNMCIFGAVALGPVIGGVVAAGGHWRTLFWIVAGLGASALLFALLTFEDDEPQDRSAPWDWVAQTLAGVGCAAAFFGASQTATHAFMDTIVFLPLVAGICLVGVLVVYEYAIKRPLMPIRRVATTLPVAGIVIAMCAGACSVALIQLTQTAFEMRATPLHLGMLFWPLFGGAVITAIAFGGVIAARSRLMMVFAFGGMVVLAGGAAVLTGVGTGPQSLVLVGSGLVGIGVGASVSPALFLAGFSQKSEILQRVFALIELLRGVAAFAAGPIILHLAETVGPNPVAGTRTAIWVCFAIAVAGLLIAACLFVLGRVRLQRPRLEPWVQGEGTALDSPPLAAGLRQRRGDAARPAKPLPG